LREVWIAEDTRLNRQVALKTLPPELAAIYAQVGEPDLAVDRLEFLLARPTVLSAPYLKVDPTWIPLRDHPRFLRLVGE